ncbi:2OG-Fe(II) oxygenase [Natronospira bacteriovora]|uniref:2OG-Fe(II) oxygenase n=1 Tax=Natronospira bacteriovora TaxID=3069753 RepID=A0ABU0W4Q9_9GAMM|nr:2OG-Fe(II) oxygenase [Natronospira sp. AB-CW4]MDQ2068743.1 2OG-Fe(II) oxygenase [Natronospira sp. AB-CW4]
MPDTPVSPLFDQLLDSLIDQGWAVSDHLLLPTEVERFRRNLRRRLQLGSFRDAAVGRAASRARVQAIRGDRICWLNPKARRGMEAAWQERIEQLRLSLNQALMLGIRHWEGHYAVYPPGARYARHVDRFRDDDARVLSTVLYLNSRWRPEYGGQLRLYPEGKSAVDLYPSPGRFVCFLSDRLPHEVIETRRERLSVVGWFRRDSSRLHGLTASRNQVGKGRPFSCRKSGLNSLAR